MKGLGSWALGLLVLIGPWSSFALAFSHDRKLGEISRSAFRKNTTAHLVFNTVSSLLQHWPNTIYRNGHTFVPATIPLGTLLHHARWEHHPPPSPEYFAFDFEHAYLFSSYVPSVVFTYSVNHDLRVGYFDGTGASQHKGPRDLQDIVFNDRFIPPDQYNPWVHAKSMCVWAKPLGLAGIVRMEPSFEAILCDIDSDLDLVSEAELVYPELPVIPHAPPATPGSNSSTSHAHRLHFQVNNHTPIFPGPTIPKHSPPPGWVGKQRAIPDVIFEAIRAGMWHNYAPGENRVRLDYSGIVSAYNEEYRSLVDSRTGLPRSKHRLGSISPEDREQLRNETRSVLTRKQRPARVNWQSLFQSVLDRHANRLEDISYILQQEANPVEVVAATRQKLLIMLSPYMVLPQVKNHKRPDGQASSERSGPDDDWFKRIYQVCASYATSGILDRGALTKQELLLASSIDGVHGEICASLTSMWMSAFDSEERPVFAERIVAEWNREVKELMDWLDWSMWVKCKPPCGPGLLCVLTTWPWEVQTGEEDVVPTCRDHIAV